MCLALALCALFIVSVPGQERTDPYLEDRFAYQEAGRKIQSAVLLSALGTIVTVAGPLIMNNDRYAAGTIVIGGAISILGIVELWSAGRIMERGMPRTRVSALTAAPSPLPTIRSHGEAQERPDERVE